MHHNTPRLSKSRRSWDILSQHLSKASRSLLILFVLFFLVATPTLHAIHDTNQNGVSDLWEKKFNSGSLYPTFDPLADADGDGWTAAQEAIAGTDPFSNLNPNGYLRPVFSHIPAVYSPGASPSDPPTLTTPGSLTTTWTTLPWKQYTLHASADLTPGSWLTVGTPEIGRGHTITQNVPITVSGSTAPPRRFLRVVVEDLDRDSDTLTDAKEAVLGSDPYSSDGDNDRLSDIAELFTHQTNPKNYDTDSDGVSDGNEILVNFTNPLTTLDADGDGIPEDFEKHFARQLLALHPEPTHWVAYYAGLLAGNLDATHDYTGDGMGVGELAGLLRKIPATSPTDSTYRVESQTRWNTLQHAYYYPPGVPYESTGQYSYSIPEAYSNSVNIIPAADTTSQYLLSRIDSVAWNHSTLYPGDKINYSIYALSAFRISPTPVHNGTKFQGRINQQRCRLISNNLDHESYSKTFIKVIKDNDYFNRINREVFTAEPLIVQLPKGKLLSEWYEFKAPIVDETGGRSAEVAVLTVDLVLAIPKPVEQVQPPALTATKPSIPFQSTTLLASLQSTEDIDFATAPSFIIPEDKEDTEGAWAVLNFDDDDEDGGASGHGQANVKGDLEDTNGVEGENDLLYLAIRGAAIDNAIFRLKFDDEHIRIYKKSNKTEEVTSEVTELVKAPGKGYITLFVEGIKPHTDDEGTIITQQIKIGATGTWNDGDTAKVRVAQPIIAVFEDNPDWAGNYLHFNNFGKEKAGEDKSRQRNTLKSAGSQPDTFLADGKFFKPGSELKDVCYSFSQIRGAKGERILKIALALQDANVIVIGHSNFGMGLAFKGQYTEFTDFFNSAGGGKPAINLIHGFPAHPALNVQGVFTNLAAADKINSLRWTSAANRWMTNNPLPNIERYRNSETPVIAPGTAFPIYADIINHVGSNGQILGSRTLNWNYKPIPGLEGDGPLDKRVILDIPSTDIPTTLRYRSLYLNQCVSYRYFLESFHHGTVFATWSCVIPDYHGHEGFIDKMLKGANWQDVELELEDKEAVNDPVGTPRPNRIELSNF